MSKGQLEVFGAAKVAMDMYKNRYDKAKAKKEQRFKDLNTNYKPGSPMFVQGRDKIVPEFNSEVDKARHELLGEFSDVLSKTIAREKAEVTVIGGSTKEILNTLSHIENMTMSLDEYNTLVGSFGNKFYWIDRMLEHLAERNGIKQTGLQPPLTTKLQILNRLEKDVQEYISEYDGAEKEFIVTSSDSYIYGLEKQYTNGYSGVGMNRKEKAKRMISEAFRKGDSMERACVLSNMLRTSEPEMQEELLTELAERDYAALSDATMSFIGIQDVVESFKKKDSADIKAADKAVENVNNAKSHQERISVIYDNLDNRHFRKAIENMIAATNDKELKESYENMQELKQKEKQDSNKNPK